MAERRPTMDDVALAAGVSRALVSLVMRGAPTVSPRRREAVLEAADRLGYAPDLIARQLASGSSQIVAVFTSDLRLPGLADLIDGLDGVAEVEGFDLVMGTGGRRTQARTRALRTLRSLRPCGLVILDPDPPLQDILAVAQGQPLMLLGACAATPGFDSVVDDGQAGAAQLIDHLVTLGHRQIVHLTGPSGPLGEARRLGYERAMVRHGLVPWLASAGAGEQAGAESVRELLSSGAQFTALAAGDDLGAIGALSALEAGGVAVPEEVSVVGYGNSFAGALGHISLTTAGPRRRELGELAMRTLLERVRGTRTEPVRHLLPPQVMIRRSTASVTRSGLLILDSPAVARSR